MRKNIFNICCWIVILAFMAGCAGYTTKTSLPSGIKTIYVPTVKNKLVLEDMLIYEPGMEVDITNAVIRRFNHEGDLKVVSRKEDADAILKIDLTRFDQEGTRFTNLESVEEYRLFITTNVQLVRPKPNGEQEILLDEKNFTGRTSYFRKTSTLEQRERNPADAREPLQTPLNTATQQAIEVYAHNVVDLITEDW
jgi:hypothetical protein